VKISHFVTDFSLKYPRLMKNNKADILLVDDVPENLIALEAVLGSPEYNLVMANSGEEALDLVDSHDFAVIILDIQMPNIDGYETAKRIKEMEKGKDVPIIFVTAIYNDDPSVKRGYEAGAVDFFGKPFNPDILKAKVGIYANLYQKTHRLQEREIELIQTKAILNCERTLKDILETLFEGVVVADKDGRITKMNEEARKIWEGSKHLAIESSIAKALLTGEITKQEKIKIRSADGKEKIIMNRASPLWGEKGEIVGAVSVIEDITHHQQVEAELAEQLQTISFQNGKHAP
jgi:CheY-like chemotaxis protein